MFEEAQPKFKRLILKIMNLTHDYDTVVIGSEGSFFFKKKIRVLSKIIFGESILMIMKNLIIVFNSFAIIFLCI